MTKKLENGFAAHFLKIDFMRAAVMIDNCVFCYCFYL